ncbi:MAG: hypothetical protein Q7V05_08450 [Methanoregula sp.]|nr:hypothetical protein [Methanoregula sp.]
MLIKKTSLDVARTQGVPCMITLTEKQIKKDLLGTHESFFLTAHEVKKIVRDEDKRKKKQARALAKGRMNFLRQKERMKMVQAARLGKLIPKKGATFRVLVPSQPVETEGIHQLVEFGKVKKVTAPRWDRQKRNYHAIDVSY